MLYMGSYLAGSLPCTDCSLRDIRLTLCSTTRCLHCVMCCSADLFIVTRLRAPHSAMPSHALMLPSSARQ